MSEYFNMIQFVNFKTHVVMSTTSLQISGLVLSCQHHPVCKFQDWCCHVNTTQCVNFRNLLHSQLTVVYVYNEQCSSCIL